jgi:hypothetical protein
MCNRRVITQPIEGPATEALERCTKRRRSENKQSNMLDHSFSFHDVFSDLAGLHGEGAFPSIAWSFDEDEDSCPSALQETLHPATSALLGMKRPRPSQSGLLRSKSFKKDLSLLNSGSASEHLATVASAVETLTTKIDDTAQIFTHRLSALSVLASLPSRSSQNPAHKLINQCSNFKR